MNLDEKQVESLAGHLLVHMKPSIESIIGQVVNGKIDRLAKTHNDFVSSQQKTNESQDKLLESLSKGQVTQAEATRNLVKSIDELHKDVEEVVEFYKGSSNFFSGSKKIFLWIAAFASAIGSLLFIKDKL